MTRFLAFAARRAALSVASVLVYTFVLSWLIERFPVLGIALALLGLLLLGATIWRALRNPTPVQALGRLVLSTGFGMAIAFGLGVILGTGGSGAPVIATPAASPSEQAPENDAPTATDEPDGKDAAPDRTAAPAVELATSEDTPDDCPACPPGGDLRSLRVLEDDVGTFLEVAVDTAATVLVWDLSQIGDPLRVTVDDDVASLDADAPTGAEVGVVEGGLVIRPPGPGPWAVTSTGGDRVPDRGHLGAGGTTDVRDRGAAATLLADALERLQRATPDVERRTADLLASLAARQVGARTFTIEVSSDTGTSTLSFVQRWPELSQVSPSGSGVWVTADRFLVCPDGACDAFDGTGLPLLAATAVLDAPSSLVLRDAPATRSGETCVVIVETPRGGPSIGQHCWRDDGLLTSVERTQIGDRLVLLDVTDEVDAAALVPPGES